MIAIPGVYEITADEYHADPVEGGSLSSTGARKILAPGTPALFRYEQLNPPAPKDTFDEGHAAHQMVLGVGPEIEVIDADAWRTNAAKDARAAAYAAGRIPLLPKTFTRIEAMAEALKRHEMAEALMRPGEGKAEQTLIWRDADTGVNRRALIDWLPKRTPGRRMLAVDYKTTANAANDAISKAVYDYGYHQQAAWYLDGITEVLGEAEPAFLFVFQEKAAPYLVNVVELDPAALRIGRDLNRRALRLYDWCRRRDEWPGYGPDVQQISLPVWVENRHLAEMPS